MAILQRLPPCETTLILVGLFVRSSCQAACPKHQAQSSFFNNPHFAVRSSPRQAFQPASWGLSVQSIRLLRRHGGRPVFGSIGEHVVSSCGLWSMFFRATTGVEALGAEHPISNLDLPANVPSSCYSLRESPTQRPHSQMMRHRSIKSSSLARHHQCHSAIEVVRGTVTEPPFLGPEVSCAEATFAVTFAVMSHRCFIASRL